MPDVSGYYQIDGIDLWTSFNILIEEGSADFLRTAPKKESITHDWRDSNGIDVDLSRFFFKEREVSLRMGIICDNEVDFWLKHDSFIATLIQPGLRRLTLKSHPNKQYFIYYQSCGNYDQIKALTGRNEEIYGPSKVAAKFTMVFVEPKPEVNRDMVYIVDEDGRFLVT